MNRVIALALMSALALPTQAQTTVAGLTPGTSRVTESGAAEYRIPIRMPPGIAGMEPKLALVYNSQAGNGLLGMGWHLEGLSSITRCPRTFAQDGVRGGVNYDWNDRYCLDGQRLIAISGSYGADGTEYRTERESFTRVISYGAAGNGPAWFKAWTRSGQIMEYGNTADAKIEGQGLPTVRVWATNTISDRHGNSIKIEYGKDAGDYYPTQIKYTATGASPNGFAALSFIYVARDDIPLRYLAGYSIQLTKLLAKIEVKRQNSIVWEYRLSHSTPQIAAPRRLLALRECIPVPADACLESVDFTYSNSDIGWEALPAAFNPPAHIWVRYNDNNGTTFADVDGDGFPDQLMRLYVDGDAPGYLYKGSPSGFSSNTTPQPPHYLYTRGFDNEGVSVVDINGDGLPDVVRSLWTPGGTYSNAWLNTGSDWVDTPAWYPPYFLYSRGFDNEGTALIDVNGDGLPDFVRHLWTSEGVYRNAWFNTGSGWTPAPAGFAPPYYLHSRGLDNEGTALVDVNGDGLVDLVRHLYVDGVSHQDAWLNTGNGWVSAPQWVPPYPLFSRGHGSEGTAFVDLNGDGLPDLVRKLWVDGATYTGAWLNTGNGWQQVADSPYVPPYYIYSRGLDNEGTEFIDVDGDGVADVVRNIWVEGVVQAGAYRNRAGRGDLLLSAAQGLRVVEFAYEPIAKVSVHAKDTQAAQYPVVNLQAAMVVVRSAKQSNGLGPAGRREVTYFYRKAKAHLQGGGFLGFGETESTEVDTGIKTLTTFRQDYPHHGLPLVVKRTQSSGSLIAQTSNAYSCKDFDADPEVCTLGVGKRYFVYISQSVETGNDLNGAALPTLTTTTQYDAFGNPTSISATTADGHTKTTTNSYANDTTNWLIGRLSRSAVQSTIP
jgi:hypothetical protein